MTQRAATHRGTTFFLVVHKPPEHRAKMVEQDMMTITDLCDDLLGMISNEVRKHRAITTITRAWRERARLLRLQNWDWVTENEKWIPEGIDDPYSDIWIDSTIREAREEEEKLPPWW